MRRYATYSLKGACLSLLVFLGAVFSANAQILTPIQPPMINGQPYVPLGGNPAICAALQQGQAAAITNAYASTVRNFPVPSPFTNCLAGLLNLIQNVLGILSLDPTQILKILLNGLIGYLCQMLLQTANSYIQPALGSLNMYYAMPGIGQMQPPLSITATQSPVSVQGALTGPVVNTTPVNATQYGSGPSGPIVQIQPNNVNSGRTIYSGAQASIDLDGDPYAYCQDANGNDAGLENVANGCPCLDSAGNNMDKYRVSGNCPSGSTATYGSRCYGFDYSKGKNAQGCYVSTTSLTAHGQYLNAGTVPYVALSSGKAGASLGACVFITNSVTQKTVWAVYGDTGPTEAVAEMSEAAATSLGITYTTAQDVRAGKAKHMGVTSNTSITEVIYPGSNCIP